jgi:hypothetical protein
MKLIITGLIVLAVAAALIVKNADAIDSYQLHNDGVTACKPPRNEAEKLVATLYKSADGGPLTLHCAYHATVSFAL